MKKNEKEWKRMKKNEKEWQEWKEWTKWKEKRMKNKKELTNGGNETNENKLKQGKEYKNRKHIQQKISFIYDKHCLLCIFRRNYLSFFQNNFPVPMFNWGDSVYKKILKLRSIKKGTHQKRV
jgi:hypothetical protein